MPRVVCSHPLPPGLIAVAAAGVSLLLLLVFPLYCTAFVIPNLKNVRTGASCSSWAFHSRHRAQIESGGSKERRAIRVVTVYSAAAGSEGDPPGMPAAEHTLRPTFGTADGVSLPRRNVLEGTARALSIALGITVGATTGWGRGLGEGVPRAEAFGGSRRPLLRCLVNAINAREFSKRLEVDLASGFKQQECRALVKAILRGLDLQECLRDAALYLPAEKRQVATDVGQAAIEYLATVVEFDAWDKLDKDWTSNVALRNMTPENVKFVRMALDAAGSSLDQFLRQFDRADVQTARETYRSYYVTVEQQDLDEKLAKKRRKEEFMKRDLESMGM